MINTIRRGNPHGKPKQALQRVQLRLSTSDVQLAKSIGNGSITEGIRAALQNKKARDCELYENSGGDFPARIIANV